MSQFPNTILLDMDGVIWRGYQPVIDIKELFELIQSNGAQAYCITNNSTGSIDNYLERLSELGVHLRQEQIVSGAVASAHFLSQAIPSQGSVYLIGESGLRETIQQAGFRIVEDDQSPVDAVVVGLDFQIDYTKIAQAANLIRDGAIFIGTNPDQTFPGPNGEYPGAGTIVAAVETAAGSKPKIMGKPEPYLYELALGIAGSTPAEALMVGDRLETDILGAQRLGMRTALVLTGVTGREEAEIWDPAPDFIAENVLELIKEMSQ